MNILEGFIETLGGSSSFKQIRDGLLSRNEQGNYDTICGILELEREEPEKQYLDALNEVLRKYILDFDAKRDEELSRQMLVRINEKFASLEQMIKSNQYRELIEQINKLEPSEITPTIKSANYYYERCTALIAAFKETLTLQSKEGMVKLAEQLPLTSKDFIEKMKFFQESLDLEKNFYLVLPGIDKKLQAI